MQPQPGSAPILTAPAGAMRGSETDGVRIFKGIPYARPPIGPARWTRPQPLPPWSGLRDATQFGPACPQPAPRPGSVYAETYDRISEDCLTLNVWTPRDAAGAPVMVWINGGALVSGASSQRMYDGARLARRGIILVSISYRLGILGYLAHPQLSAESPDGLSGNYGLSDQIAALRWVQRNISAFGGDPARVTLVGESAGALSILYLMVAPAARGLFARAILQSAYMISTPELRTRRFGEGPAEKIGAELAAKLGADLPGLRARDPLALTEVAAAAGYAPFGTIDGHILPCQLVEAFDRGEQTPIPVLTGFNSGEIRSLRFLAPAPPASPQDYMREIRARYGALADAFLHLYPADAMAQSILAATRDALYGWTSIRLAEQQTKRGQPAFVYLWDHAYPAATAQDLHAFHASELPYLFGTADRLTPIWPAPPDTGPERALSDTIAEYWTSFVHSGQPTARAAPAWPAWDARHPYLAICAQPEPAQPLLPGMYALHEAMVAARRAQGDIPWNWNVGLYAPPLPA